MKPITLFTAVWLATCASSVVAAEQPYTLAQLLSLALSHNQGVHASAAGVDAARAGIVSSEAYPNPEVELLSGRLSARQAGAAAGSAHTVSITQRIDLPSQRYLRREIAGKTFEATVAGRRQYLSDLTARVKQGYYETLRREAEFLAAEESLVLMQQIYDRAQVRVDVGDAPRYESIKASAELLNAQKTSQSALLRVNQAKSFLRQQIGGVLPLGFSLAGGLEGAPDVAALETLRTNMLRSNPELEQLRTELERAGLALDYEKSLRLPTVALRASADREPDVRGTRAGIAFSVPLWDRRKGPIDEAAAMRMRVRSLLEEREFVLAQELDSAYQQFLIASSQVEALTSGIVIEAESALRIAEAAYRFGERGILDYLDAQRVLRVARTELIAAQFDLQLAAVEIERLMANSTSTLGTTP